MYNATYMSIRVATLQDIDDMFDISRVLHLSKPYIDLVANSLIHKYEKVYTDSDDARKLYRHRIERYILGDTRWAYVCEADGEVAGFRLMTRDVHGLHLKGLFVKSSLQGHGIGTKLFQTFLDHQSPGEAVDLEVLSENMRARKMYEKHGFKATDDQVPDFFGAKKIRMIYSE